MANKTIKKKKAFQADCRKMVKDGSINDSNGGWIRADMGKSMHRDCFFGYKLGRTGRKKGKTSQGTAKAEG